MNMSMRTTENETAVEFQRSNNSGGSSTSTSTSKRRRRWSLDREWERQQGTQSWRSVRATRTVWSGLI
jgi:hypothetical protein